MKIDPANRGKYKSVYDGLCGKLGKSVGSIYVLGSAILFNTSNFRDTVVMALPFVWATSACWFLVVIYLGKKYNDSVSRNAYIDEGKMISDEEIGAKAAPKEMKV